jgi:hypothetical protein
LFGIATSAAAGNLWITCEPGLDVYLDGQFVGVSERAEDGKYLPGISSGEHTIRIEKAGFAPVEVSIAVGPASNQIVVGELGPEIKEGLPGAAEGKEAEQLEGKIRITSNPRECNVKFADRRVLKKQPIMTITGIPIGEHKLWFESAGTVLSTTVAVQATQTTQVMADFSNNRVTVVDADSDQSGSESAGEEERPRAETECVEYWVQVMRTSDPEAIEPARSALKEQGFPLYHQKLIAIADDGTLPVYKLRVGPITRRNKANHVTGLLKHGGFKTAWVVPEECQ